MPNDFVRLPIALDLQKKLRTKKEKPKASPSKNRIKKAER